MTRTGRVLLAAVIAAAALTSLLWVFACANGLSSGPSASYAVLSVPRDAVDRTIVAALSKEGIDDIVSESTQWITINDFGDWENVPLDTFRDRIEKFDPRDDGYAERVRSLFFTDRNRLLFLKQPVSLFRFSDDSSFNRAVAHAMGTVPYTLNSGGTKNTSVLPFLFTFIAVAAVAFLSKSIVPLAGLPSILAVAGFGSGGLVVAGLICVCFMMMYRSFAEFARSQPTELHKKKKVPWVFDSLLPGSLFCILSLVVSLLGALPQVVVLLAILSSVSIAFVTVGLSRIWDKRRAHARFHPVGLRANAPNAVVRLSSIILPFAVAASIFTIGELFLLYSKNPNRGISSVTAKIAFNLNDYTAHLEKQRSFLTTRVMDADAEKGYTLFSVGSDGFTSVSDQPVKKLPPPRAELPPAERFLAEIGAGRAPSGQPAVLGKSTFDFVRTFAELAIAFALSFPALRAFSSKRRQLKAATAVADKRIAA